MKAYRPANLLTTQPPLIALIGNTNACFMYLSVVALPSDHNYCRNVLFPYHLPEVPKRFCKRKTRQNVKFVLAIQKSKFIFNIKFEKQKHNLWILNIPTQH